MKTVPEMLTTAEGCNALNLKLFALCFADHAAKTREFAKHVGIVPNFLAGWGPETQKYDEALVDGDLALRLVMALGRYSPLLNWSHSGQRWHVAISLPIDQDVSEGRPRRAEAVHAHLVAALVLVAGELGLLEEVEA